MLALTPSYYLVQVASALDAPSPPCDPAAINANNSSISTYGVKLSQTKDGISSLPIQIQVNLEPNSFDENFMVLTVMNWIDMPWQSFPGMLCVPPRQLTEEGKLPTNILRPFDFLYTFQLPKGQHPNIPSVALNIGPWHRSRPGLSCRSGISNCQWIKLSNLRPLLERCARAHPQCSSLQLKALLPCLSGLAGGL